MRTNRFSKSLCPLVSAILSPPPPSCPTCRYGSTCLRVHDRDRIPLYDCPKSPSLNVDYGCLSFDYQPECRYSKTEWDAQPCLISIAKRYTILESETEQTKQALEGYLQELKEAGIDEG